MADTHKITPAVRRTAEAVWEQRGAGPSSRDAIPAFYDEAAGYVTAALDGEEIARSVADNLYGQDVHTLVMRRPGESHRDQAERIGQWAAEIVLAAIVGENARG